MLIPPKPGCELHDAIKNHSGQAAVPHPFWAGEGLTTDSAEDTPRKRQWRISQEQMSLLRESAKKFEGTHNFHNFTVGRDYTDKSSQRHMKTIEIADPAVYGDTEWISIMIHGQSFMLHQVSLLTNTDSCTYQKYVTMQIVSDLPPHCLQAHILLAQNDVRLGPDLSNGDAFENH